MRVGVMNAGIAGNRVLSDGAFQAGINALARFEHNVLAQPGVTHVVFMEGINDIGAARQNPTPTAEDLIAGHKQIIDRAHERGLKIYGGTLTPFYGAAYYSEVGEQKRTAVRGVAGGLAVLALLAVLAATGVISMEATAISDALGWCSAIEIVSPGGHSFPSGHAAGSFAFAGFVSVRVPRWTLVAGIYAAIVAWSSCDRATVSPPRTRRPRGC